MSNDVLNQVIITDDGIEFMGFPLFPDSGTISVFHTENSFTIHPILKTGVFYNSFNVVNRKIEKNTDAKEYALFRAMIEELDKRDAYNFVEYDCIYYIVLQ